MLSANNQGGRSSFDSSAKTDVVDYPISFLHKNLEVIPYDLGALAATSPVVAAIAQGESGTGLTQATFMVSVNAVQAYRWIAIGF